MKIARSGAAKKISIALTYLGQTEAWLAGKLGKTPQAFNKRMRNSNFTTDDLSDIAHAMGCDFEFHFVFKDGTEI